MNSDAVVFCNHPHNGVY